MDSLSKEETILIKSSKKSLCKGQVWRNFIPLMKDSSLKLWAIQLSEFQRFFTFMIGLIKTQEGMQDLKCFFILQFLQDSLQEF